MTPFINLLLRTHDRPAGFKRMLDSIRSQTYQNYRVIVSVDNDRTRDYVIENGISDFIYIEKNPSMSYPADSYFNYMISDVIKGFIWGVDDDDYLPHDRVLEIIAENIKKDTISIFKMKNPNTIIPGAPYFGKSIEVCHIGTPCFVVPIEIARMAEWHGESGSDFRYIKELSNIIGMDKIYWIDEIVYIVDKPNQRGKGEYQ